MVVVQQKIDRQKGTFEKIEKFSYLPSGQFLSVAALEYREAFADLLWLRAIQYVGSADRNEMGNSWFFGVLDRVTDLDPNFAYAYQFGGIVLSVMSDEVALSNAILEKGLKNRPDYWQIPFHLGFNYFYHMKDSLEAAKYMEIASKIEGHPPYLPLLVARFYSKGDEEKTALVFLLSVYENTRDERIKMKIAERIEAFRKGEKF
jgi:hypothetical protein